MPGLVSGIDVLYALCLAALPVATTFVLLSGKGDKSRTLRDRFALTALFLFAWVASLYVFHRFRVFGLENTPGVVLLLGRVNFAAVVFVVYFAYRFVQSFALAETKIARKLASWLLLMETMGIGLLTLLTPLVGKAENIVLEESVPVTVYGVLFPLYVLHIVLYLAATIHLALTARRTAEHPVRDQLGLVAVGIIATGSVALVTNAALPYLLGDFRFTDVGTLSTMLFLLAVGWAVVRHRLFNLKSFLSRTLVYGLLLSLVAAAYSAVVVLVTERLTSGSRGMWAQFGVLLIASSFDPVRRFLEKKVDALLFRKTGSADAAGETRSAR